MKHPRGRNVLLAALALSVLLHLLLAGYFYWPNNGQQVREQVSNVRIMRIQRRPPPPQTPAPRVAPAISAATPRIRVRSHVALPKVSRSKGGAPAAAHPAAIATPATARPSAQPSTGCARPDAAPALSANGDVPEIPPAARARKTSGVAAIDVALAADGSVVETKVERSSGNGDLDAVAVQMAKAATYTPRYVACKSVAGTFTYTVKFAAW